MHKILLNRHNYAPFILVPFPECVMHSGIARNHVQSASMLPFLLLPILSVVLFTAAVPGLFANAPSDITHSYRFVGAYLYISPDHMAVLDSPDGSKQVNWHIDLCGADARPCCC